MSECGNAVARCLKVRHWFSLVIVCALGLIPGRAAQQTSANAPAASINLDKMVSVLNYGAKRTCQKDAGGFPIHATVPTPESTGTDISNAPWNKYPERWYKWDFVKKYPVAERRDKPFRNSDTWDFIAIQRAVFENQFGTIWFPEGVYYVNQTIVINGTMEFMDSQDGVSFYGGGGVKTAIQGFDESKDTVHMNFAGKCPMFFFGVSFSGKPGTNYSGNTAAVHLSHCNQINFMNCWFTCRTYAIKIDQKSQDCSVTSCTFEFYRCAIWIETAQAMTLANNKFWNLDGGPLPYPNPSGQGNLAGNAITIANCSVQAGLTPSINISNNIFENYYLKTFNPGIAWINVLNSKNVSISNNVFKLTVLGIRCTGSATDGATEYVTITGNTGEGCLGKSMGSFLQISSYASFINVTGNTFHTDGPVAISLIRNNLTSPPVRNALITGNLFSVKADPKMPNHSAIMSLTQGSSFGTGSDNVQISNNLITGAGAISRTPGLNMTGSPNVMNQNNLVSTGE